MKYKLIKRPITYSIVSTIIIYVLFALPHFTPIGIWIDSALRVAFTIPVITRLGYIINGNGLKFAFSTKGFAKGVFACAAMLLFILLHIAQFLNMVEINAAIITVIPAVVIQQVATGLFEESLFRGLLMTALLHKCSNNIKGRIGVVIISGILFGTCHLLNIIYGGEIAGIITQAFNAGLIGMGFSAVYLYSKNLLCCMFIHALWDIVVHLSNIWISEWHHGMLYQVIQVSQYILLYIIIPLFAIFISIKAKPFHDEYSTD